MFEIDDTSLENHMPQTVVNALNMLSQQMESLFGKEADTVFGKEAGTVLYKPDCELISVKVANTDDKISDKMPENDVEMKLTADVH